MVTPDVSMAGKVCMVTGATAGIGKVTALELAQRGAAVVVVGRSEARCQATVSQIRQKTGNPSVAFLLADLSSQQDVRRLAAEFNSSYSRLDVLVNNAGAIMLSRRESVDGIEMTFALNHLAYFLLTHLLLDKLKSSAPARIVNVSSNSHERAKLDLDDLQTRKRYWGFGAYARSKLANILFSYELARRLEGTGVTVNVLHPGLVGTNFLANNGALGRILKTLVAIKGMSPERGARTSVYLAASPEVESVTGRYFFREQEAASSDSSHDEDAALRLWHISAELTGLPVDAR